MLKPIDLSINADRLPSQPDRLTLLPPSLRPTGLVALLVQSLNDIAYATTLSPGEELPYPEKHAYVYLGDWLSNYDATHRMRDEYSDTALRAGRCWCGYTGWDFYANVWFEDEMYHACVLRFKRVQATITAPTLIQLIGLVCDRYGSD